MDTFFSTGDHGNLFLSNGGISSLVRLLSMPILPISFSDSMVAQPLAMVFRSLSGLNPAGVIKEVISSMSAQFHALDGITSWRDGRILGDKCMIYFLSAMLTFVAADANKAILQSLLSLDCLTRVLGVLTRESSSISRIPANIFSEWTTEAGANVCLSLGQLQRYMPV